MNLHIDMNEDWVDWRKDMKIHITMCKRVSLLCSLSAGKKIMVSCSVVILWNQLQQRSCSIPVYTYNVLTYFDPDYIMCLLSSKVVAY